MSQPGSPTHDIVFTPYMPSPRNPTRQSDQTRNLNLIGAALSERWTSGQPRLIGVQGAHGSGKTQLALRLVETGINVRYIDVLQHHRVTACRAYDIAPLLMDPATTFVIDEAGYANQASLCRAIAALTHLGGIVVLLFQRFWDLDTALIQNMVQFDLLQGRLIERPAQLRFGARSARRPFPSFSSVPTAQRSEVLE